MKNKLRNIECPACKGAVIEDVEKCKHCGCDVQVKLRDKTGCLGCEKLIIIGLMVFGIVLISVIISPPLEFLNIDPATGLYTIGIPLYFFYLYRLLKYVERYEKRKREKNKVFIVVEDEK